MINKIHNFKKKSQTHLHNGHEYRALHVGMHLVNIKNHCSCLVISLGNVTVERSADQKKEEKKRKEERKSCTLSAAGYLFDYQFPFFLGSLIRSIYFSDESKIYVANAYSFLPKKNLKKWFDKILSRLFGWVSSD